MSGKVFEMGVVSWETFDELIENQYDMHRKVKFLIKAGNSLGEEGIALEAVADLVSHQEEQLNLLRKKGLEERNESGGTGVRVLPSLRELEMDSRLSESDDSRFFLKLMEICRVGGTPWENMKALIQGTHSTLFQDEAHS